MCIRDRDYGFCLIQLTNFSGSETTEQAARDMVDSFVWDTEGSVSYTHLKHNVRYIAITDGVDSLTRQEMDITPFKNILHDMYSLSLIHIWIWL